MSYRVEVERGRGWIVVVGELCLFFFIIWGFCVLGGRRWYGWFLIVRVIFCFGEFVEIDRLVLEFRVWLVF